MDVTCNRCGKTLRIINDGDGIHTCSPQMVKEEPTLAEHMRRIAKSKSPKKSDAARKNLELANAALKANREKEKQE